MILPLLLLACSARPADTHVADTDAADTDVADTDLADTDAVDADAVDTDVADTDQPVDCDDETCCSEPESPLVICGRDLPWETPVRGAFTSVDAREWTFAGTDGTAYRLSVYDDVGLAPDLLGLGEVVVEDGGGCASDGEIQTGGVFAIRSVDGAPLLLVGTGDATVATAGDPLDIRYDWNDTTCPTRESDGCFEQVRSVPVTVTSGAESVVLHQPQHAVLGGLEVRLLRAERGVGSPDCTDVGGTDANWIVRPAP